MFLREVPHGSCSHCSFSIFGSVVVSDSVSAFLFSVCHFFSRLFIGLMFAPSSIIFPSYTYTEALGPPSVFLGLILNGLIPNSTRGIRLYNQQSFSPSQTPRVPDSLPETQGTPSSHRVGHTLRLHAIHPTPPPSAPLATRGMKRRWPTSLYWVLYEDSPNPVSQNSAEGCILDLLSYSCFYFYFNRRPCF